MNGSKYFNVIILLAVALGGLTACARQGQITGGPKDTKAPELDTLSSTPNYTTRFNQRFIELKFDEWLALKDPAQQVVMSPPLAKNPKVTLDGKTVKVDLGENANLRPNTTYTINFGGAITDFHEGNAFKDLRFVFATGDVLDSLELRGTAYDGFTGDPVENVTIALYDVLTDSIPLKEKPYYFSKTDKNGQFKIQNIRPGAFKCIGIDEGNASDLRWNGGGERIGYTDSLVIIADSIKNQQIRLRVFKTELPFKLTEKNVARYGVARLGYSRTPPASTPIRASEVASSVRFLVEPAQDSLLVWYDWPADTTPVAWHLIAGTRDSVAIKALSRADFLQKHRVKIADDIPVAKGKTKGAPAAQPAGPIPIKTLTQNPSKKAVLPFNVPISVVDTSKWVLMLDSTAAVRDFTVRLDSISPRSQVLELKWLPGRLYRLTLLPGAVTDFYGQMLADTILRQYNVLDDKSFGTLNLTMAQLKPGTSYILQLVSGNSTVEAERRFIATKTDQKELFPAFAAGTFTARLIEDVNANGIWDTGNYFAHRQPERVFIKKLDPLRANWELEATIEAVDNFGAKKSKSTSNFDTPPPGTKKQ
jgi:hypothetical protein